MFENFVIVLIKPEINLNFNKHIWEMAIFGIIFKIFKFAKISVDLQNLQKFLWTCKICSITVRGEENNLCKVLLECVFIFGPQSFWKTCSDRICSGSCSSRRAFCGYKRSVLVTVNSLEYRRMS